MKKSCLVACWVLKVDLMSCQHCSQCSLLRTQQPCQQQWQRSSGKKKIGLSVSKVGMMSLRAEKKKLAVSFQIETRRSQRQMDHQMLHHRTPRQHHRQCPRLGLQLLRLLAGVALFP